MKKYLILLFLIVTSISLEAQNVIVYRKDTTAGAGKNLIVTPYYLSTHSSGSSLTGDNKTIVVEGGVIRGDTTGRGYSLITGKQFSDGLAGKQNTLSLTTTGTSGVATLVGSTLNIPQYTGGGGIDTSVYIHNTLDKINIANYYITGSGKLGTPYTSTQKIIYFGNSLTFQRKFSNPLSNYLASIEFNKGIGGSKLHDFASRYSEIPTIVADSVNVYKYIMLEYGLNDDAANYTLSDFSTCLTNALNTIVSKGWVKSKIVVIGTTYNYSKLSARSKTYSDTCKAIANRIGVIFAETYEYMKANGGNSLLTPTDSVHPTDAGGIVLMRAILRSLPGCQENSGGLSIMGGIRSHSTINANGAYYLNDLPIISVKNYNNSIGTSSGIAITTGNYNTNIGSLSANVLTTGNYNTFVGYSSGTLSTTASNNTGVGQSTLVYNLTGTTNTAVGSYALWKTTNSGNSALGYNALSSCTLGNYNDAFGSSSLGSLNTGTANAGFGSSSLGSVTSGGYNTSVGNTSLYRITTGGHNCGLGNIAMQWLTTGSYNIGIGDNAGSLLSPSGNNQTPSYSIYIGDATRASAAGNTNEIVIGSQAVGNGSNTVTLGNASNTAIYLKGTTITSKYTLSALNTAPTSATDTGTLGEIRIVSDYIYVCIAANSWVRTALTTW